MDGIEVIKQILASQPDARILVLTSFTGDEYVIPSIEVGALGFLTKDSYPEDLIIAIQQVYLGEPAIDPVIAWKAIRGISEERPSQTMSKLLSERELEVLRLLAVGKSNQEIAEQLSLTEVTVRTHISHILAKLGLANRVQAALYALRTGLTMLEDSA
jgi:NarL family two-component system response regulator LiaR